MATLPTETTEIKKNTPLPQAVVAVEKIPQWLGQTRLSQNPFTDFITTTNHEKEGFFRAEMKKRHDSIMTYQQRLKKEVQEATTEAQWRRKVWHLLRSLKNIMIEWQLWHQLWLCAKNGWLGGPLWHLRTARQGDELAALMAKDMPLTDHTLSDGRKAPKKKDFKSMQVTNQHKWQALARQIEGSLTMDRVAVDAGRVPFPHNENTHSDNSTVAKYLYRTGRLGETDAAENTLLTDSSTHAPSDDEKPTEHTAVDEEADSVPRKKPTPTDSGSENTNNNPQKSSDEQAVEEEENLHGGLEAASVPESDVPAIRVAKKDAQRFHEKAKACIYSNFADVKAVKMRHIKEKAWMRGYPNPWDMFGEFVEQYNGIQRYEYNRGEKHDNRKENYILDLHTGYIWLVPGVEGFGVYKALTKVYEDTDAEISSALAWMRLSKNEALEAQSRHTRLEYLLQRAENNGMHSVHELFENEQAGVGPPPSSRRLDNLEERIQNFETAEEQIQANQNTPSNEAMSQ